MASPQSYERGRFYVGPNGFPRFAGSASGVYLADTVRTELSPGQSIQRPSIPEDAFISRNDEIRPREDEVASYAHFTLQATDLKHHAKIRDCLKRYFRIWHRLFPFLDGAYIINALDGAVSLAQLDEAAASIHTSGHDAQNSRPSNRGAFDGLKDEEALILSAIFKAVISIGAMDLSAEQKNGLPILFSTTQTTMLGHFIVGTSENSSVSDVLAIQALLGIELYLYLSRLFRPAMHISGVISKLAFEAGLHRCPERYTSTFTQPADRQLRKRVFYSLYVLDRLLTADFGIPIMLHDSDIDTCAPGGTETHSTEEQSPGHPARNPDTAPTIGRSENGERPLKRLRTSTLETPASSSPSLTQSYPESDKSRLLPLYSLVGITRLGGRAMEAFNKSLNYRRLDFDGTLQLRTDLESWWNDMVLDEDGDDADTTTDPRSRYSALFTCLYHQQIISLSRPALSLSPNRMENAHALQTAVTSARTICSVLYRHVVTEAIEVFWPGYVDMVFFAALILVYSAKRDAQAGRMDNNRSKAALNKANKILQRLLLRWPGISSFVKILDNLTSPPQPMPDTQPDIPDQSTTTAEPSSFDNISFGQTDPVAANDLSWAGFSFDFNTFEINPDAMWAFQHSIPGSPTFM